MSLLLLLAAGLSQPVDTDGATELTVIAEQLRSWRGSMREESGQTRCFTRQSSGDADIDKIGCDTMVHCFRANRDALNAANSRETRAQRRQAGAEANRVLTACFTERHDLLTAQLAERRYQARQGTNIAED